MALGAVAGSALWEMANREAFAQAAPAQKLAARANPGLSTTEPRTAFKDATSYNNYYEFGLDKGDPAENAHTLKTRPWTVSIEGEIKKPMRLDIDGLMKLAPLEERVYRLRCVEGWSMVIPWVGYSLSNLIKHVEPNGNAKYVEFTTLADPKQMPGLRSGVLDWPYVEGLRLDEAMHPLALLTVGMYGQVLPNQNGAPVRVVLPWKYGFKSAKSIVRIRFLREPAEDGLERLGAVRIRLLFEREPEGRPPALVAGDRTAHRRRRLLQEETRNADVQRLPGSRVAVRGHGPEKVLLTMAFNPPAKQVSLIKGAVFVAALLPFVWGLWLVLRQVPVDPLEYITHETGDWALYLLCATLAVTPLRRLSGWNWLRQTAPHAGAVHLLLRAAALHRLPLVRPFLRLSPRCCATSPSGPSSWSVLPPSCCSFRWPRPAPTA